MTRIVLAIRAFFRVLLNVETAQRVQAALSGPAEPDRATAPMQPAVVPKTASKTASKTAPKTASPAAPPRPSRSEAITLLATLQREARLLDFFGEPIDAFSDAQIGAAVRDVHRQCGEVLERLFALAPVVDDQEGVQVEVPVGFDAGRYRLVGNVSGEPPHRGQLTHHGWMATKCELPEWSGDEAGALIVASAEVELR